MGRRRKVKPAGEPERGHFYFVGADVGGAVPLRGASLLLDQRREFRRGDPPQRLQFKCYPTTAFSPFGRLDESVRRNQFHGPSRRY